MAAPDKIYVPTRFQLVDGLRVRERDTDVCYIRKDAVLDILENSKHLADAAYKIDEL